MTETSSAFKVHAHTVEVECLERTRWRVRVDGRTCATFCTESRARAAGRAEARRLDYPPLSRDGLR